MKSLTDYWRAKFVELQKQIDEERKKQNTEKKVLKNEIFEHTAKIKELETKIAELEKIIVSKDKEITALINQQNTVIEKYQNELEVQKNESDEHLRVIVQEKNNEIVTIISEVVRFLKKDAGYINGIAKVCDEFCKEKKIKTLAKNLIEHTEWLIQHADELVWFTQPFTKEEGTVKPDILIDEIITEFKEIAGKLNIKISKEIAEIPELPIPSQHLKICFTEIIRNCFDAMPQGGTLTIKMYSSENNAVVEISDTGRGIPAHLMEKISQPFFSTKKKVGFGVGLTKVRKILDTYKCKLDIFSEEDKGTTVKITTSTK
ncbi:MAG: ATP-binding protein [Elusimicrobiota bacterium]